MAEQTVRVLDAETQQIITIPASELTPGMMRVRIEGVEGDVFVEAGTLETSPHRHPPFDEKTRDFLRQLQEALAEVRPKTVEQWEDGFRRDAHPDREMRFWAGVAACYRHFIEGKVHGHAVRQDIFRLVFVCLNTGPDAALATVNLAVLSRKRAGQITAEIAAKATEEA
jgi:hypothetical protein